MSIPDVGAVSELQDVYVTNGTMTSDGPGPGHKRVPPREAAWLCGEVPGANRLAVRGTGKPKLGTEQATDALNRYYNRQQAPPAGAAPNYQPRADGSWAPPWSDPEETA